MAYTHDRVMESNGAQGIAKYVRPYVTGFERTRLPRTQQEDTLFTITRYSCTH